MYQHKQTGGSMRESPVCFSYPFSAYIGLFLPIFANKFAYVQFL